MKRFLRHMTLMMSLLCLGLTLPATAQTPLLEVDYHGATIFHVLSDGRLLLPAGAQDGYVLTATAAGFASWQAVSGSGGAVTSDVTLTGDGTPGSPLGVSVPLVLTGGTGSGGTVYGEHIEGHRGLLGGEFSGVFGLHSNGNVGELGSSNYGAYGFSNTSAGVYGAHSNGSFGLLGSGNQGVYGEHSNGHLGVVGADGSGVLGLHGSNGNIGTLGSSDYGAYGFSNTEAGVYGEHSNGFFGILGSSNYGVYGFSNGGAGIYGFSNVDPGVLGRSDVTGVQGIGDAIGVSGISTSGIGVKGSSTSGLAGSFSGDVQVNGTLSKSGGSFKIDHPLDPEGQYLSHSFVESPDMMNVYNGNVTTDAAGEAVVTLPEYFEALNRDFRYQLTVIGTFAQAIIAEEIQVNQFVIRTDEPQVKVSWQVTGIRHDPWAEANRIAVEEAKPAAEQGRYLHPALYDQPEVQRIGLVEDNQASADQAVMQQQRDEERRRMQAEHERFQTERPQHPPPRDNQP